MAVDRDFPDVQRRLRWLADEIAQIERSLLPTGGPHGYHGEGNTAVYVLEQHSRELDQTTYLLRYYERQNNGYHLSKMQWGMFMASLAVAGTLLALFLLERFL